MGCEPSLETRSGCGAVGSAGTGQTTAPRWAHWTLRVLWLIGVLVVVLADPATVSASSGVVGDPGPWRLATGEGKGWSAGHFDDSSWSEIQLPASWSELGLDGDQTVWFRRVLELEPDWRSSLAPNGLAILVGRGQWGSYELFANGRRIGSHRADDRVPVPRRRLFPVADGLVDQDGRLAIALVFEPAPWLLDRRAREGPILSSLVVGDRGVLEARLELGRLRERRRHLPLALLAAIIAVAGLYHLQLFAFRRQQIQHLVFSGLVLSGVVVTGLTALGTTTFLTVEGRLRIWAVVVHLAVALTVGTLALLAGRAPGRWGWWRIGSHGVVAFLALVIPSAAWLELGEAVRWAWILVTLLGELPGVVRELRAGDRERRLIASGVLVYLSAFSLQGVSQVVGGRDLPWVLPLGFAVLGTVLAVAASNRFSRVQQELEELRLRLEQRVEDGTEELAHTNQRLRSEIAERQLVEEAMRMLERSVEQSIDGMAVTDLAGSAHFLNESWARMHGHDVYDILGYDISLFHTTEQMQKQVYPLMAQVRGQGSFQGEVGHRRKNGEEFPTWMTVTLLQDESGEPVGMVVIARDTSGRRQEAEEQLLLEKKAQQAEKLESLAGLASRMAHDYNNLLTGLLGNTSLLLRDLEAGSEEAQRVVQIEMAAERAAELSDQLLSYAGEEQISPEPSHLGELIESSRGALEALIPSTVELQFQLKEGLPTVSIDRRHIRRVLEVLLRNAVESLSEGRGVITVRTSRVDADRTYMEKAFPALEAGAGSYVFFEVSDSGAGIDEQTRKRIFDPFFSTKSEGRGLGLSSALGIVRAHGGAIKVYSQIDRGTTFEVLFPVSGAAPVARREVGEIQDWQAAGTVLVVDDEELVREVARDILEGHGFEVLTARDGQEAVERYRVEGEGIRIVLLDLTMPRMDGEQAFREIRRLNPGAKVVLMSGYSKKQARQRLEGEGLGGFLHKPFRPAELVALLRQLLEV